MMKGSLEKSRKKFQKFLELNENKNTTYQNLYDIRQAILKGKFMATCNYITTSERLHIMIYGKAS